jgi:hypothetical protein
MATPFPSQGLEQESSRSEPSGEKLVYYAARLLLDRSQV